MSDILNNNEQIIVTNQQLAIKARFVESSIFPIDVQEWRGYESKNFVKNIVHNEVKMAEIMKMAADTAHSTEKRHAKFTHKISNYQPYYFDIKIAQKRREQKLNYDTARLFQLNEALKVWDSWAFNGQKDPKNKLLNYGLFSHPNTIQSSDATLTAGNELSEIVEIINQLLIDVKRDCEGEQGMIMVGFTGDKMKNILSLPFGLATTSIRKYLIENFPAHIAFKPDLSGFAGEVGSEIVEQDRIYAVYKPYASLLTVPTDVDMNNSIGPAITRNYFDNDKDCSVDIFTLPNNAVNLAVKGSVNYVDITVPTKIIEKKQSMLKQNGEAKASRFFAKKPTPALENE